MQEPKWMRVRYMPGTGIGKDGARVTGSREHIALSRKAASEGMVLLKNEGEALPLARGQRLAVFGKAQADYVKGGGGSGDTTVAYIHSLLDGLRIKEDEGKVELFSPLSDYYEDNVKAQYIKGIQPGFTVEPPVTLVSEARAFTDTALITICRFSKEGHDRTGQPFDGDFYLSREESAMAKTVMEAFDRVIVVLNVGGMMETGWIRDNEKISAALMAWQGGMEGGLAAADILCGDVNPSGHLTDTFAIGFDAYPSSATFDISDDYVEYNDDIYVGYRYFETVPGAKEKVVYPFGYGLSYTTFRLTDCDVRPAGDGFMASLTVTNTGFRPGREVVQVYCEAPQGKLGKPARVLVGFQKTKTIKPGCSENLEIPFTSYLFASYDDTGLVREAAYVLERGDYKFHIGVNVRETVKAPFVFSLNDDVVLEQLSHKCVPKQLHERMLADGSMRALEADDTFPRPDDDQSKLPPDGQPPLECLTISYESQWEEPVELRVDDVWTGKVSMDDFIAHLDDTMLVNLLGGQPNRGVANTLGFGNLPLYGIPNVMTADGPQGLRIRPGRGVYTTALPCAMLMACTWDPALQSAMNKAGAEEVRENGFGVWLTPAINIHRTPRCGRNFEYYSEDPLLTGKMAAAAVKGIQSEGVACSMKHFACNNKETNRRESDSRLSERALREIYLKGFEICVKEADPWTIMSSYNMINGVRASENRELLTDILRGEWGFNGVVTTDWYTHGEQYREINAGNDIKMGCGMPEETLKKLHSGELDREALLTSVKRLLGLFMKLA